MKKIFFVTIMFAFFQIGKAQDIEVSVPLSVSQLYQIVYSCPGCIALSVNLQKKTLRFREGGKIIGGGTVENGYIDANYNQEDLFDKDIILQSMRPFDQNFSACWFGASPNNPDNTDNFQRAINTCYALHVPLFIPPRGIYNYSMSLQIGKGEGQAQGFHMFGGTPFFSTKDFTTLNYSGTGNSYALGIQIGKGIEINNMKITGQYLPPQNAEDYSYYLTKTTEYVDANGQACDDNYAGISIDPDSYYQQAGSTGIKIHDVTITNFATDFWISRADDKNGDILIFENIHVADSKYGFYGTFNEQKGNVVRGLYSSGRMHTLINIGTGTYPRNKAGFWTFDGGYITGKCIRLAHIVAKGTFATKIKDFYCENLGSIGTITNAGNDSHTQPPIYIQGCNFDFVSIPTPQVILLVENRMQTFESCRFRYINPYPDSKLYFSSMNSDFRYLNCTYNYPLIRVPVGNIFIMQ